MGAEGFLDTEQALLGGVRPPEADTAGRDAGGPGARPGHGRDRSDRHAPVVEDVREVLGRPDPGSGREPEQLVREGVVVRPATVAGPRPRIQHRRDADAPATSAGREVREVLGERDEARAGVHTGDQLGRSGRDKRGDQRAADCRVQDRVYLEYTAERSHDKRHVLSRHESHKRTSHCSFDCTVEGEMRIDRPLTERVRFTFRSSTGIPRESKTYTISTLTSSGNCTGSSSRWTAICCESAYSAVTGTRARFQ